MVKRLPGSWKFIFALLALVFAFYFGYRLVMRPMTFIGIRATLTSKQPDGNDINKYPKTSPGGWETAGSCGNYCRQINYTAHLQRWYNPKTGDSWVFDNSMAEHEQPWAISDDGQQMLLIPNYPAPSFTEKIRERITGYDPDFPPGRAGRVRVVRRQFKFVAQLPVTVYPHPSCMNMKWHHYQIESIHFLPDGRSIALGTGGTIDHKWLVFKW